nr:hypothetical protein CFP56_53524 [Quercus suber]
MIIGRFLALDKEETCVPVLVRGGLIVEKRFILKLGENMIIGRFLALDKEETCVPVLVRGGLIVEKVLIDEVLAINESTP